MAEFRISQGLDVGVSGRSRVDLVPGTVITLEVTEPVGPGVTYTWRIIDAVNSVAVLTSTTAETTDIGSSGAQIVELCGFLIELEANDGGTITTDRRVACVPHAATGIRTPLFGESAPRTQTLALNDPDLSTDNALYSNLGGRGVSGQNPFGWREWAWRVVKALADVQESGGSAVVQTVPGLTATIADDTRHVLVLDGSGEVELTAPPAIAGRIFDIAKCNSDTGSVIRLIAAGGDTIDGNADYGLPASDGFFTVAQEFVCAVDGEWTAKYDGLGVLAYTALFSLEMLINDVEADVLVLESKAGHSTFVWRPGSATPGVFATAAQVFAAAATAPGIVTILCDPSIDSTFQILAGTYPFACATLRFEGIEQPILEFGDGITLTGSIRTIEFKTVDVEWAGATGPLLTGLQGVSLVGPCEIYALPAAAVPMFNFSVSGGLVCRGSFINIDSNGNFELFNVESGLYTFIDNAQLGEDTFRGPGGVIVFYNPGDGGNISLTQTNLGGGVILQPTNTAETNRILALESPLAPSRSNLNSDPSYTWISSAVKRLAILYDVAKFDLTLDKAGWEEGDVGQLECLNAGGFGVEVILADSGDTINGMAAGVGYTTLPGSDIVPSGTVLPARFQVTYYGSGAWGIG